MHTGVYIYVDCKTVGFFLKSAKKSVKRGVRVLRAPTARVFSLVPHLLFDCSRVLEYAKIRTVLQSNIYIWLATLRTVCNPVQTKLCLNGFVGT